jgi:tetratricopeptide (TPR) repeat protein
MAGRGLRGSRTALVVAALALLAGAPGVLAAAGVRSPWALGGAAAVAAVVVAFGAVAQDSYTRHVQRRDERMFSIQDGCLVLAGGGLPKVRDITDPVRIGVHKAAPAPARAGTGTGTPRGEDAPGYVPRDIDDELREQLKAGGFVLLVGDSTAGKSRAAFEAMTTTLPGHLLIWPASRDAVPAALAHAAGTRRCVVWLDDLEGYLGDGGVTVAQVNRLLVGGEHHRVIIATIRTAERQRLLADEGETDAEARQVLRETRLVLGQAREIRVSRMFSGPELDRTRSRAEDPRIAEALTHSGSYGIAEYLAAGPELLSDWEDARDSSDGQHARGAALVAAAVDIRRAGHTSPIPRALLDQVHERYLEEPGHAGIGCEPLADAWAWATMRRRATTALLPPAEGDRIEVFDYLVDVIQRRSHPGGHAPEPIVRAAIDSGDPADTDSLGDTAFYQGRWALAEHAWHRALQEKTDSPAFGAEHPRTLGNRGDRAFMLQRLGRPEEAEAEQRAVIRIQERVLGSEHPDTLASRGNLASTLLDLGRVEESAAELRAVLRVLERVLGPEHRSTLINRGNLASALRSLGRPEEAEAEHRAVLEIQERVLGAEDHVTLNTRVNHALALRDLKRFAEAEAELRDVTEIRTRTLGAEDYSTLQSRADHASALHELGQHPEAEAEIRAVLEKATQALGPEHRDVLVTRSYRALILSALGRRAEAEAEYRTVLPIQERVLGTEHPSTVTTRNNLTVLLHDLGSHHDHDPP